jgi:hypothetical protein
MGMAVHLAGDGWVAECNKCRLECHGIVKYNGLLRGCLWGQMQVQSLNYVSLNKVLRMHYCVVLHCIAKLHQVGGPLQTQNQRGAVP